jgi:outer membrane protein assembly factor BamD
MRNSYRLLIITGVLGASTLCSAFPFRHKKYETPITKDTLQPDKILFDRATKDIEKGNYEVARLTLNTLINTYDTSEYLAKAKLAIADSWYREGGTHGLASAEAEYKDFELFYPNMEEAAQSQFRVCEIHYRQMEKADRDSAQAQHAEDECRQVMVQYPNSKYVSKAQQMLRETQEVLADKEFKTGDFYHHKGSFPAAANRMAYVSQQYPLYSGSDEALWRLSDSYKHMGDHFENQEADALTKIVRDYPLSSHVDDAKSRLTAMKRPVPQADPAAYARMKYELDNATRPGMVHRTLSVFSSRPDTSLSAKSGAPQMVSIRPSVPVSVPAAAAGGASGVSDVGISLTADTAAIDQKPEARIGTPAAGAAGGDEQKASVGANGQSVTPAGTASPATPISPQSLPTNHPMTVQQFKELKKAAERAQKNAKKHPAKADPATAVAPAATTTPATTTTPAATDSTPQK